jgi:hypothetical protein
MRVYAFMLLVTIPYVMTFSAGMPLLDMMPAGYAHDYVVRLLQALGEDGRDAYLTKQIPVDMIYPGLFGCTYALIFLYFLNKTGNLQSRWNVISYFPIVSGASDYIENFFFIDMLTSYPTIIGQRVSIAAIFSVVKSTTTTLYFIALTVLLLYLAIRTVKRFRKLPGRG